MVTTTWIGGTDNMQWSNPNVDPIFNPWNTSSNWDNGIPGMGDVAILNNTSTTSYVVDVASLVLNNSSLLVSNSILVGYLNPGVISGGLIYLHGANFIAGSGVSSATGIVEIGSGASYEWNGTNSTQTIKMASVDPDHSPVESSVFSFSTQFDGTIEAFYVHNVINFNVNGASITGMSLDGHTVTYKTTAGNYTLKFGDNVDVSDLIFDVSTGKITTLQIDPNAPCFAKGTLIRTVRGDVAVETLKVGDLVVTSSGAERPIVWLGCYNLKRTRSSQYEISRPVRIQANAFGEQQPYADLWLSPGHAVCVRVLDEVLIPIGYLINGATIKQVDVAEITYWHVELETHDILIANGLPTESYLDCGTRALFHQSSHKRRRIDICEVTAQYCRPLTLDRSSVEAVAIRLRERAKLLGWSTTSDMDIHVVADGMRINPQGTGNLMRFQIPSNARDVHILSETFIPAEWSDGGDTRKLGISINGFQISDDQGQCRRIEAADACLDQECYQVEFYDNKSWRWTSGSLRVPNTIFADLSENRFLELNINAGGQQRWLKPIIASERRESVETAPLGMVAACALFAPAPAFPNLLFKSPSTLSVDLDYLNAGDE